MASGGMVVAAITLGVAGFLGAMPMERGHGDVELAGVHLPWLVPVLGMGIVAAVFAYALGIAAARELGSKLAAFLRSEEHTSELQSLMRISYAVFCLKKKTKSKKDQTKTIKYTELLHNATTLQIHMHTHNK